MRKLGLVLAMVALVAGASVSARNRLGGQRFDIQYDIAIQDDATGNYLMFNSVGGQYKFVHCSDGVVMTGRGSVKRNGCMIYLEHIADNYKVLASANECTQTASAAVQVFDTVDTNPPLPPMKEFLNDESMKDNTMDCRGKKRD